LEYRIAEKFSNYREYTKLSQNEKRIITKLLFNVARSGDIDKFEQEDLIRLSTKYFKESISDEDFFALHELVLGYTHNRKRHMDA
jgi:uncharacterized protein YfaT (DUF1175 family)